MVSSYYNSFCGFSLRGKLRMFHGDLAYGGVGDLTLDPGAENDADDPVAEDAQPTAIALNPEPVEGVPPAATAPACARSRGGGRTTRGDGAGPRLIPGRGRRWRTRHRRRTLARAIIPQQRLTPSSFGVNAISKREKLNRGEGDRWVPYFERDYW